ncbi:MAG: DUF4325 domain-containing protein [Cytophagaceae bacterium]|nr:MAG: DUF4325 domain-containing protein [Cytophagaceae bacterium]
MRISHVKKPDTSAINQPLATYQPKRRANGRWPKFAHPPLRAIVQGVLVSRMKVYAVADLGSDLSSRAIARQFRDLYLPIRQPEAFPVELSFKGVQTATQSFLDELLAVVIQQKGPQWFRENVVLTHMSNAIALNLIEAASYRVGPERRGANNGP